MRRTGSPPLLVFQAPTEPREPSEAPALLEGLPFRLMSETEHEWATRGGAASRLTWRGDDVPDEAWMEAVMAERASLANGFGLREVGLAPEVLCDAYRPTYEGAPTDGSPRTGPGPRVVRGGAEMAYPWQESGEWILLTNAARASTDAWEYFLSLRPCLGVRCDGS